VVVSYNCLRHVSHFDIQRIIALIGETVMLIRQNWDKHKSIITTGRNTKSAGAYIKLTEVNVVNIDLIACIYILTIIL
jgi:hypothetical protein